MRFLLRYSAFVLFLFLAHYNYAQITVTSTADSGAGSLREAIATANSNPGADLIEFDASISGSTITLDAVLSVTSGNGDATTIDGDIDGDNIPDITIQPSSTTFDGFNVTASNCTLKSLHMKGFTSGIYSAMHIRLSTAIGNKIIGCRLGVTPDGTATDGATVGQAILLTDGADGTLIGDGTEAGANVIGNSTTGIMMQSSASNTVVSGNYIGISLSGSDIGNDYGIRLFDNVSNTKIGVANDIPNIISFNNRPINMSGASVISTTILNNYIGTDKTGLLDKGNTGTTVIHISNCKNTFIGDGTVVGRNIIAGNDGTAIWLQNSCNNTQIYGNYIGIGADGSTALANGSGIKIDVVPTNTIIGDGTPGGRNIISSSSGTSLNGQGIYAAGPSTTIQGNYIGTDATGTLNRGNNQSGVLLAGSFSGTVGGISAGTGNLVSGNSDGIKIEVGGADILGNYIGTDVTGTLAISNASDGIWFNTNGANSNIGNGTSAGANVISGNGANGILFSGSGTNVTSNNINFNLIGVQSDGASPLGNGNNGIYVGKGANKNNITSNIIANNTANGILIGQDGFTGNVDNTVTQNSIYNNTSGGIVLVNGANNSITAPVISSISTAGLITGTAPIDSKVEIFFDNASQGEQYHDFTTANGAGDWSYDIDVEDVPTGLNNVTATATDGLNTSEFSNTFTSPFDLYEVVNTNDSGGGSLRWCMENANANTGVNTITFNIPNTDGNYLNTGGDERWTISPVTELPDITEQIIIDATTQSGTGNYRIKIDGQGALDDGFYTVAQTEIYGFYITGFSLNGGSTAVHVFGGSDGSIVGNIGKGNVFNDNSRGITFWTADNLIVKSNLIGTDETGTSAIPNVTGIYISSISTNNTIGGTVAGEENIISGNSGYGIEVFLGGSQSIIGNKIGTDITGLSAIPNANGVFINSGDGNSFTDNIISGNIGVGVNMRTNGNIFYGNNIGVGSDGTTALPNNIGIIGSATDMDYTIIGGVGAGQGNIIAHNTAQGVYLDDATYDFNQIIGNSIFCNGKRGIDLNLANASSAFGNDAKTAPDITNVTTSSVSGTGVDGDVIHLYRDNSGCVPIQGAEYLGTTTVASGTWTINEGTILASDQLNATATDVSGNTSQFTYDYPSDWFTVVNTNDSGMGSLREAINQANSIAGINTIDFNIPDTDPNYLNSAGDERWTISPLTDLENITETVIIDATTQPGSGDFRIKIDGKGTLVNGLQIRSTPVYIYGLYVTGFTDNGIYGLNPGSGGLHVGDVGKGNVINNCGTGISTATASNHVIKGNFIGTDETGMAAVPNNTGIGMTTASNVIIGGSLVGEGNVISGNTGTGINQNVGNNHYYENNIIGANATGTAAIPNNIGIQFGTSGGHQVLNNVISGNSNSGIRYINSGSTTVQGNNIGVGLNGTDPIPNGIGVLGFTTLGASNNTIGGTNAGEPNRIAHNVNQGVSFTNANHINNQILGNSIFCNGGKGIDLNGVGNDNKAAPFISGHTTTDVSGTGTNGDVIHVYRDNSGCVPLQGEEYLGSATVAGGVWTVGGLTINLADNITATATDASGNTSEFTIIAPGHALDFDGVNDFVSIPHDAAFSSSSLTIEFWFYKNNTTIDETVGYADVEGLVYKAPDTGANDIAFGFELSDSDSGPGNALPFNLSFAVGDGTLISDVRFNNIDPQKWYHIAGVIDGNNIELFVNGQSRGTATSPSPIIQNTNEIVLGKTSSNSLANRFFNGKIDELRIWNTARTQTDIQNNMFTALPGNEANLAAYYKFDQGIAGGNNTSPAVNQLPDISPNNHNGTLNNFALNGNTSNWVNSNAFAPNTPSNLLSIDATYGLNSPEVTLTWEDNSSDETDFEIDRAEDAAFTVNLQTLNFGSSNAGSTANYTDNTVSDGTLYFYRVRATKSVGNSGYSNTTTAVPVVEAGNAASFDAAAEFIEVTPSIQTRSDWSFSCWFKDNGMTTNQKIYSEGSPAVRLSIEKFNFEKGIRVGVLNGSWQYMYSSPIIPGEWNFMAFSVTGADATGGAAILMVNNTVVTGDMHVLGASVNRAVFGKNVGSAFGAQPAQAWVGDVDEASIWSRALSTAEMIALRDSGIQPGDPDLIGLWHFDEPNSSTTVYDASGNGNDGTRTNNPQQVVSKALHPFAPQTFSVVPTNGQVELDWEESFITDFKEYNIAYKLNSDVTYTTIQEPIVNNNTRTFSGLTNGELYDFKVSATDVVNQIGPESLEVHEVPEIFTGNAAIFDGTNSAITIPDNNIFNRGIGLTLEAWIRPDNLNGTQQYLAGVSNAFGLTINTSNQLEFFTNDGGSGEAGSDPAALLTQGAWTHVAMTFESGTPNVTNLYVGGDLVHTSTTAPVPQNSTMSFTMGASGSQFFNGMIDEVRLWDGVVDITTLNSNAYTPLRGDETGVGDNVVDLLALWHMDEPTGHAIAYSTPTNLYNGVLSGNADFGVSGAMFIPFITTWSTTDGQITIPTSGTGHNYNISWSNLSNTGVGDGSITGQTGNYTITGLTNGDIYQVEITGMFPRIDFSTITSERVKILSIEQWGDISWSSMNSAFFNCTNLTIPATDAPDLSLVTDLSRMFYNADSFNESIDHWDVSNVTNIDLMFSETLLFNQPLNSWNVGNVTTMFQTFQDNPVFNQDLPSWNVSKVTDMSSMFALASSFNGDISTWDVSSVTNMSYMFEFAIAFNQDIGSWIVGNVVDMTGMFGSANSFNQDIGNWDVSSVASFTQMFSGASSFNQNIGGWDVSIANDMSSMLDNSGLSTANYDALLIAWNALPSLQPDNKFGASGISFCTGATAHQAIIDNYSWQITDAGELCPTNPEIEVINGLDNLISGDAFIDFGNGVLGNNLSQTITINNIGSSDLSITGYSFFEGTMFSTVAGSSVIASGGTLDLEIIMDGSMIGAFSDQLTIFSDDVDEGSFVIQLDGVITAVAEPEIEVFVDGANTASGSNASLGNSIQNTDLVVNVNINNTGGLPLNVTSIQLSSGASFSVSGITIPAIIAANSSANFTITLDGLTIGVYNDQLTIISDDVDEGTFLINISGEITVPPEPEIEVLVDATNAVSGTSIDLGSAVIGNDITVSITINNTGTADLNVSDIQFTSGISYSVVGITLPTVVTASGSANFAITLSGLSVGVFSDQLTITSNDADEGTFAINFTGEILAAPEPEIAVYQGGDNTGVEINNNQATAIDFGTVSEGTDIDRVFAIENTGTADLTISTISLSGSDFSIVGTIPSVVTTGATANFTVRLSGAAAGTFSDQVNISNNDVDESAFTIDIIGTINSIAVLEPEIAVYYGQDNTGVEITNNQATPIDVDKAVQGSDIVTLFAIENTGSAALDITNIEVTGTAYTVNSIPALVEVNGLEVFAVLLSGNEVGEFIETVTISSNDSDESTFQFVITGIIEGVIIRDGEDNTGGIVINNQDVDLGTTEINVDIDHAFVVENLSPSDLLVVDSITVDNPIFEVLDFSREVLPGEFIQFTIRLNARDIGRYTTNVNVYTSINNFSFVVVGEVVATDPPDLNVYNLVTPNGDGIHDFFKIGNITYYMGNSVVIYDRWGGKVFEIKGYDNANNQFNGDANVGGNKMLDTGNYYYVIDKGDGSKPINGFIFLKR